MSKSALNDLWINTLEKLRTLPSPHRVVVGVSGGCDSMVVWHLLREAGFQCIIAHVNYGKRGAHSDADEALVRRMAAEHHHPIAVLHPKKPSSTRNFQDWARTVRYDFFKELAERHQAAWIATAHHKDDAVETLLMNLFRRGGSDALRGMRFQENNIVRPLLSFSKPELYALAERFSIPFREDESNAGTSFNRNWIRNSFAPELDARFPGWRDNLLRASTDISSSESEAHVFAGQSLGFDAFVTLPAEQMGRVLKKVLQSNGISVRRAFLHSLCEGIPQLQPGQRLSLDAHHFLLRDHDRLFIQSADEPLVTQLWLWREQLHQSQLVQGVHISLAPYDGIVSSNDLRLDADTLSWPICLRTWKHGDAIQPLGFKNGTKKVSDILTDAKLSHTKRDAVLVLESFDSTIHAVIFPRKSNKVGVISERAKLKEASGTTLIFKY